MRERIEMSEDRAVAHERADAARRCARSGSHQAAVEGATAVEYGIMLATIAAVIVIVVAFLGLQSKSQFCDTARTFQQTGQMGPTDVSSVCS